MASCPLRDVERRILSYLAIVEDASRYGMSREMDRPYSNVYNSVRDLLGLGLVEVVKTKRGGRNPRIEVEYYGLTALGLVSALMCSEGAWERIDEIAEKHGDLAPLVLGKWGHFKRVGLGEAAIERLKHAVNFNIKALYGWPLGREERLLKVLTDAFHDPLHLPEEFRVEGVDMLNLEERIRVSRERWIGALMDDPDLKLYIHERLKELKRLLEQQIKEKRRELEFITSFVEEGGD